MRLLRSYVALVRGLMAPAESVDPADVASWALRRWVARSLIALPIFPLVLGGMWLWGRVDDHLRDRRLDASPCMTAVPELFLVEHGPLTASGSAMDGRCDLYWNGPGHDTVLHVVWTERGPWTGIGEHPVDTWDDFGPERVEEVEDGGGNRFVVITPVLDGRLELRPSPEVQLPRVVRRIVDGLH